MNTKPLESFENGSRVIKPNAIPQDFAFRRVGEVVRETVDGKDLIGVRWYGSHLYFEYGPDTLFASAEPLYAAPGRRDAD
jgi:hypothetical protein